MHCKVAMAVQVLCMCICKVAVQPAETWLVDDRMDGQVPAQSQVHAWYRCAVVQLVVCIFRGSTAQYADIAALQPNQLYKF